MTSGSNICPAFDDMHGVAVEIPDVIEPGPVPLIGHVDDKSIALPATARVTHEEMDVWWEMRTSIGGNHAIGMRVVPEDQQVVRGLNNLAASGTIRMLWRRVGKTVHYRVDVRRKVIPHLRRCPGLVGDAAVRRVHDQTLPTGTVHPLGGMSVLSLCS